MSSKKIISSIIFVLAFLSLKAQTDLSSKNVDLRPAILPQSPEAQKFKLYGDYPVSLATGIPDISVPVYNISLKNGFNFPIELKYHSSGFKPSETDGIVGLGWSLMASYRITRTVKGLPDELYPNNILPEITDPTNDDIINYMYIGGHDTGYDNFDYTINNLSGKYILKRSNGQFSPMLTPLEPIKVELIDNNLDTKITDAQGNMYMFGKDASGNDQSETTYPLSTIPGPARTSWLLTSIITKNQEVVKFNYITYNVTQANGASFKYDGSTRFVSIFQTLAKQENSVSSAYMSANQYNFSAKQLSSIETPNESIEFHYSSTNYWTAKLLDITIYDLTHTIIKVIKLQQANYSGSLRSKLANVSFLPASLNISKAETYQFGYNEIYAVPEYNMTNTDKVDFWGYYIGYTPQFVYPGSIPEFLTWNGSNSSQRPADPKPDLSSTSIGVLSSITYPTGGKSVFQFDLNQFRALNGTTQPIGGLRVSSITNYNNNGTFVNKKVFNYGPNEDGTGLVPFDPYDLKFRYAEDRVEMPSHDVQYDMWYHITYYSSPMYDIHANGLPIYYQQVTEYTINNDNTIFSLPLDINSVTGKKVSNFIFSGQYNTSALDYSFYTQYNCGYYTNRFLSNNNSIYGFRPSSIITYKVDGNTYKSILAENYYYTYINRESVYEAKFMRMENSVSSDPYNINSKGRYAKNGCAAFTFDKAVFNSGKYLLDSTTSVITDGLAPIINRKHYTYDPIYFLTRTEQEIDSKEDPINKSYKYSFDYALSPYDQLLQANRISDIVDYYYSKGSSTVHRNIGYKDWGNYIVEPETINEQIGSGSLMTKLRYLNYDVKHNSISLKQEKGAPVSYLYGYNRLYPIAQVINATKDQVAFSNCEEPGLDGDEDDNGTNILFNNNVSSAFSSDSRTGRRSYNLVDGANNYIETVNPLPPATYIVSYWAKGSGTIGFDDYYNPYDEINVPADNRGWAYHQITVNVPRSDYFEMYPDQGGNPLLVDDIRIYPKGSQMVSYTYDPLIGVTSITDAKNQTTFYEYDDLQRLYRVKDLSGNIIKQYCYNYAGQATDCSVPYVAVINNGNTGTTPTCIGENYKPINGVCEAGVKVYTDSSLNGNIYVCTYHYRWSDNSLSPNYTETSSSACYVGAVDQ